MDQHQLDRLEKFGERRRRVVGQRGRKQQCVLLGAAGVGKTTLCAALDAHSPARGSVAFHEAVVSTTITRRRRAAAAARVATPWDNVSAATLRAELGDGDCCVESLNVLDVSSKATADEQRRCICDPLTKCVLLVYDVTKRDTFDTLCDALLPVLPAADGGSAFQPPHVILVANFVDRIEPDPYEALYADLQDIESSLSSSSSSSFASSKAGKAGAHAGPTRAVSRAEGEWLAHMVNGDYVEISASTSPQEDIADLFRAVMSREHMRRIDDAGLSDEFEVADPARCISPVRDWERVKRFRAAKVRARLIGLLPGSVRLPYDVGCPLIEEMSEGEIAHWNARALDE